MKNEKKEEIGIFLYLFRENPLYMPQKCCFFAP